MDGEIKMKPVKVIMINGRGETDDRTALKSEKERREEEKT